MTGNDTGIIGYMCTIDYECELGNAAGGNVVYPSIEDLKKNHHCWEQCGIVEVRVMLGETVVHSNWWGTK